MSATMPGPGRGAAEGGMPVWSFVPLDEYRPPDLPVRSAAAEAWAGLKRLLARTDDGAELPACREQALRRMSQLRLEHLVRPIDWAQVAADLDAVVDPRAGSGDEVAAVTFLVGQPHCGHAALVQAWAARHDADLVAAPTAAAILGADPRWPGPGAAGRGLWALPSLERCFLRHASGLALVRELMQDIACGRVGRGLVGCDSWAWAYLRRVWPLPQPRVLTLQAFDGAALARLFAQLAVAQADAPLHFRNARTGREALSVPAAPESSAVSEELAQLAAHCRGNPGVARSYWRERLRAEPEDKGAAAKPLLAEDAAVAADHARARASGRIVWVSDALEEPLMPLESDEETALLLHALLPHDGLTEELLPEVVPLARHRCAALVSRLHRGGLLEPRGGRWTVAALGYPLVRRWLRGRDHLTDDF